MSTNPYVPQPILDAIAAEITGNNTAYSFNVNSQPAAALPNLRKVLAKIRGGTGNGKLLCIGDSTTAGYGAATANSWVAAKSVSYPAILTKILTALGVNSSDSSFFGCQNIPGTNGGSFTTVAAYDTRLAYTSGWVEALPIGVSPFAGGAIENATNANILGFTPANQTDTIDVYWSSFPGTGSMTVSNGATLLATYNENVTAAIHHNIESAVLGANTYNFASISGVVVFQGAICYASGTPELSIINAGYSGATSNNLVDTSQTYSYLNEIGLIAPDCSIIYIGTNDWGTGVSVPTYKANVQTVIKACQVSGDVILVAPPPSANATVPLSTQANYVAALYQLSLEFNIPLVDLTGRWISYEFSNPFGYYSNTIHPSGQGYSDIARAMNQMFLKF